jgi:hypothetical protein
LGNLSTPNGVQKLQKALHAKAKAEAGYRFYALYDKISREDILAHVYRIAFLVPVTRWSACNLFSLGIHSERRPDREDRGAACPLASLTFI